MYQAWRDVTECIDCGDLKAAFEQAVTDAKSGDTIILSPGCASYDQFGNYQERGQYFTHLVHAVVDKRKHLKVNGG
jgi:UDP-N-acetylmuramoylalanine--D-glutamate ligase